MKRGRKAAIRYHHLLGLRQKVGEQNAVAATIAETASIPTAIHIQMIAADRLTPDVSPKK
jgi:hypothetical protein